MFCKNGSGSSHKIPAIKSLKSKIIKVKYHQSLKEVKSMANQNKVVPNAKGALDRMKYEIAGQLGVNLKQGYNGDLAARDAGRVGGNITRKLIQMAESQISGQ